MSDLPEHLRAGVDMSSMASDSDLSRARTLGMELVSLRAEVKSLEAQISERNKRILEIERRELPDLMAEIQIDSVGLPQAGVDVVADAYYHANIASDWEPERREAAFSWLEDNGHGDLVKVEPSVLFPRGSLEEARRVEAAIRQVTNQPVSMGMLVPWNTLTSWLRERVMAGEQIPLETLGATVARAVKIRKRKEKI